MSKKSNKYYYLVSGFPELKFGGKLPFTVETFINEFGSEIKELDWELINLIFLRNDIKNLKLLFMEKLKTENITKPSVYTIEELKENVKVKEALPEFIIKFIEKYENNEEYLNHFTELEKDYFIYCSSSDNFFLNEYFKFELNFKNAIASIRARERNIDVVKYSVGESDDIIISKIKNNKSLPDFGITGEAIWMGKLIEVFDKKDTLNLEQSLDKIRFEQIDFITALLDFDLEKVLAYIVQLSILEKWNLYDEEEGSTFTKNIIRDVV